MITCPTCHTNPAFMHPKFGALNCSSCQTRLSSLSHPNKQIEFTTDSIKHQRQEFMPDIEQDHYKGALNKRWVETYGVEAAKKRGYTDKEIKNAKYTYDGAIRYYNDRS